MARAASIGRWAALALGVVLSAIPMAWVWAEYADVIMNEQSDRADMRPVIFPHWFHRIRYRCAVCHAELGFEMQAGANPITMEAIIRGRYCGACHDGRTAWGPERCELCHSGQPGLPTGVRGGHETTGPGRW